MSNDYVSKNHQHPKARLCHIKKWDNFDGYGFNLHAEKGKLGQYIGKVDEGSPAEAAGLRQGDRILEVNGESIANKTHKQVVELIKGNPNETQLLVVDPHDEVDNGNSNGISIIPIDPTKNQEDKQSDRDSIASNDTSKEERKENGSSNGTGNGILNLSMTAAELRAKLAAKKKFDPKKEAMDFKQKFDIVQKL